MQNTRNRQAENDLQNKDVTSVELSTKSMKAVIEERDAESNDKKFTGKKTTIKQQQTLLIRWNQTWRQKRLNKG